MAYALIVPPSFRRQLKKFVKTHPDLREAVTVVLRQLEADPFHQRLHLHPLNGQLVGCHAVSVTYSYRITLILQIDASEIVLLDIGSHDDVYR